MEIFLEKLNQIAPIDPTLAAYRIHGRIGDKNLHFFADRDESKRPWRAVKNGLMEHSERAIYHPDIEVFEIFVNSLFTAPEVHAVAKFFFEKFAIKIDVVRQPWPVPLLKSYLSLDFSENDYDPTVFYYGNSDVQMPVQILAFLYDIVGTRDEIWIENHLEEKFTARNRLVIRSIDFPPDKEGLPLDFSIHAYEEAENACFFDTLKGVHDQVSSQLASEE